MIGLPSLHTLDRAQAARIWLAAEATDMRCGFDRLAERVRAVIGQDPLRGHLFQCPFDCTQFGSRVPAHTNHSPLSSFKRQAI